MIELFSSPDTVARLLLNMNCVELSPDNPFQYASGLKGPIYCDNRLMLGHPVERKQIVELLIQLTKKIQTHHQIDQIGGLATAGIPHASFIAHELNKPLLYVRGKGKDHGKKNQIEGFYKKGQNVLLVEDLVNQASSLEDAILALREVGLKVEHCICIMTYQTKKSIEIAKNLGVTIHTLTDIFSLINIAKQDGHIDESGVALLESWQKDPANWKK